jgi:hypothetical protein
LRIECGVKKWPDRKSELENPLFEDALEKATGGSDRVPMQSTLTQTGNIFRLETYGDIKSSVPTMTLSFCYNHNYTFIITNHNPRL